MGNPGFEGTRGVGVVDRCVPNTERRDGKRKHHVGVKYKTSGFVETSKLVIVGYRKIFFLSDERALSRLLLIRRFGYWFRFGC